MPKIFSIADESFVNEEISKTTIQMPTCENGSVLRQLIVNDENEETFVLLSDDGSLFVSSDTTTHEQFCVQPDFLGSGVQETFIYQLGIVLYCIVFY